MATRLRERPGWWPTFGRASDKRLAAILGLALGVSFSVSFLTGMYSYIAQNPVSWFSFPTRPAGLFRVTQGLHVATGIATVPLLLAKLWSVYPLFWTWPPVQSAGHAVERLSLVPLVGGSLFLLFSGVANVARWYPYEFNFTAVHYSVAWITMGGLVVHIAAKVGETRSALRRGGGGVPARDASGLSRRGFIGSVAGASAVLTVATIGQTFRPFRALSVLGPRDPQVGPQGVPVNKSAAGAGVERSATDPAWRLVVEGRIDRPLSLSLADLRAMPQHEAVLPIACVEGWSAEGRWGGVRVRDLLESSGARPGARVRVESLQRRSRYRTSPLTAAQIADPDTLLALDLGGEPLHIDHGFPVRLIAPGRPGVLQTKWLSRMVVR